MGKSTPPEEPLSRKDVRELIQLIRKNEIQEFELEQGDLKLRIVTSRIDQNEPKHNSTGQGAYPNMVYPPHPGYLYPPAPTGYGGVSANPGTVPGAPPVVPHAENPNNPSPAAAPAPPTAETPAEEEDDPNLKKVTSPMVGTFYRAPAPDAKPYVDVGIRVEEETVLCIVEAMKLMNEIKAEMRGVVRRILVENGQPVEYGQPLFLIDPS